MTEVRHGLAKRSVVGVLWTALSMGALALAEIIALVVLARLLSPEDFGLYAATLVIIRLSTIFSSLGVAPAIVQRPELEERHLRVGFTLSLLMSLGVAGLIWLAAPAFADFLRLDDLASVVRVASVVFICQGIAMVALASAQRALRFRWLASVDACCFAVGFVLFGPVMALLDFGFWTLIGALVIQHALRMVILLIGQPHPKRLMLERRTIGELLYFGGGFTLAKIFNYLANQADRLIVGRWLGAQALGVYSLAAQIMTAPAMIVGQVLDRVLFPTMARVQQEPARLTRAYRTGVAGCTLLVLPAGVVVASVAPELVLVLLGPGWEAVVAPLQILAAGMLFRTSYKLSDTLARATGAVYARAWRQAVFVAAIVVASLIGQRWGVTGVALGVVAAITCNFLLMAQLSLRLIGMGWAEFFAVHTPGLALAAVTGAGAWLLAEWLRETGVSSIMLLLAVMLAAAAAGLLLCWTLPALFLGRDGRSVVGLIADLVKTRLQRRRAE